MTRINLNPPQELTRQHLIEALAKNGYYVQTTAKFLGIKRATLISLMKKFDIEKVRCNKGNTKPKHEFNIQKVNNVYYKMISRCCDENNKDFLRYGGRGIKVCDRWLESRDNFYLDLRELPNAFNEGYTLDRIDNNGNYEPDNVKFSTKKEQARNTCRNIIINYNEVSMSLPELVELTGIRYSRLEDRLNLGFTVQEAVSMGLYRKRLKDRFNIIKRGLGKFTAISCKLGKKLEKDYRYKCPESLVKSLADALLWCISIYGDFESDYQELQIDKILRNFNICEINRERIAKRLSGDKS